MSSSRRPSVIADRYEVVSVLGEGGMGVVYKAWDPLMKRTVAIKMLRYGDNEKELVRFQREARALGKLKSDYIVSVSDFGRESDSESYLVMDYVEGDSLASRLRREDSVDLEEALEILQQICRAMEYAHSNGVLHRDLKPSNIVVTSDHSENLLVKVLDFGLARLSGDDRITETGIGIGSPPYMAPEQVRGEYVDEKTDIYSFGCLMFELLAGAKPFLGKSAAETAQLQLNADPPLLAELVGEESDRVAFQDVVRKCLEKDPELRFQSFADVEQAMERVFEHSPEAGEFEEEFVEASTNYRLVYLIAFLLMASFFVVAMFLSKAEEPSPTTKKAAIDVGHSLLKADGLDRRKVYVSMAAKDSQLKEIREKIRELGDENVKGLAFVGSSIEGPGLRGFRDLPVTYISFRQALISDNTLAEVAHLEQVNFIKLNYAKGFTDAGLEHLTNLKLTHISLIETNTGDRGLMYLSKIKTLNAVNLQGCRKVTASGLEYLTRLPILQTLDLSKTSLSREKLHVLSSFPALGNLLLLETSGCSEEDILELRKKLPDTDIKQSFESRINQEFLIR